MHHTIEHWIQPYEVQAIAWGTKKNYCEKQTTLKSSISASSKSH